MSDIKAVIFDFGGVIVRTEDWSGRRQWAERLGLDPDALYRLVFDSEAAIRATLGEVPASAVWAHVAQTLGLEADQLEACRRDFWAGDRVDTVLVDLIRSLRPRYKTAILSNAWSDARELFTHQYGLDQAMDEIIISAEEGLAKPDPRLYQRAAARLGVQPAEAVFVDDVEANVAAARAVGMQAIHFQPGLDVRRELEALGVEVPVGPGLGTPGRPND